MRDRLLKQFLVLFALTLMPLGTWAQTYCGLSIGDYEGDGTLSSGVRVSTDNASNITSPCIQGTSVNFDINSRTLTLNNATINGTIYSYGELTINLIGDNQIIATDSGAILNTMSADAQNLTFKGTGRLIAKPYSSICVDGFNTPTYKDGQSLLLGNLYYTFVIGTQLFSGGNGTSADNSYLIGNTTDLKNLSLYHKEGLIEGSKFFLVNDDLDCTNLTGFEPIGSSSNPFIGTFDGNNKVISNLTCEPTGFNDAVGFFGKVGSDAAGATVKNLILQDCTINGYANSCGAIAGSFILGNLTNCKVKGSTSVYCEGGANGALAGAIVGYYDDGAGFNGNYYDYTVETTTKEGDYTFKEGYDMRGTGVDVNQNGIFDIFADDGAVMYTKKVNIPGETEQGSVEGAEERYGREGADYESEMYIAPGETAMFSVRCEDGYIPQTVQVTYGTPATTINPTLESISGNCYYYNFEMPDDEATISVTYANATGYNLLIGNTQVTSINKDDVLGDGKVSLSIGGDVAAIYTLTLNGAELTAPIKVGLPNLTFDIQGANSITTTETCIQKMENTDPSVTFKSTSSTVGSLILTHEGGVTEIGNVTVSNELAVMMTVYGYDDYTSNMYYFTDGSTSVAKFVPSLGVKVGDIQVYAGNATNVLRDEDTPTVVFDAENRILTLNGANISGAIRSSLPNLIIELDGNSSISSGGDRTLQAGSAVNMTIQSSAKNGRLSMHKSYSSTELGNFVDGNVNLTIAAPLSVLSGSLTSNATENDYYATIGMTYDLTVGGVQVNSENASDIIGDAITDGKVSFTPGDGTNGNILTLTGASINGTIESGLDDLTIKLEGTNHLDDASSNYTFKASKNTASIKFACEDGGRLDMTTSGSDAPFEGFADGKITYDKLVYWYDNTNQVHTIQAPTAPAMAVDADEKVTLTKPYADGDIYYTIAYADGTTPGVSKTKYTAAFALEAPGTVEAWAEANGATTNKTKGKHFGYQDAPYTLKVGDSKSIVIIPAMGDGISLVTSPESSNDGIATCSEGVITAKELGNAILTAMLQSTSGVVILNDENVVKATIKVGESLDNYFEEGNEYASYYNETVETYAVPEGMKAYVVTGVNGSEVVIEETTVLPPNTVVLLEKGTATLFTKTPAAGSAPGGNLLKHATSNVSVTSESKIYVLYKDEFVKATSGKPIPTGMNYLELTGPATARSLSISHGDGDTVGIDQIYDVRTEMSDVWYDLQGRRINKPSKAGLYIVKGKLVMYNNK